MKSRLTIALVTLLCLIVMGLSSAVCEQISGDTSEEKTFFVTVDGPNASISLTSWKGIAKIERHILFIFTGEIYEEENHGFYTVTVRSNGRFISDYLWVPSATRQAQNNQIENEVLTIYFPGTGQYSIEVIPHNPYQEWVEDELIEWTKNAIWKVTGSNNCTYSISENNTSMNPSSGVIDATSSYSTSTNETISTSVIIEHIGMDGVLLGSRLETFTIGDHTIYPDYYSTSYNGVNYTLYLPTSEHLTIYSNGLASTSKIVFYYQVEEQEKPIVDNSNSSNTDTYYSSGYDNDSEIYGLAINKLATRYGPSTSYQEGGTYSVKGQYIRILAKSYDSANGIWWVKCEIPYKGENRILWTGLKRFDTSTFDLDSVPIE